MFCNKCGHALPMGATLCSKCGTITGFSNTVNYGRIHTAHDAGPEMRVSVDGMACRNWETYVSFDGKPFSRICSKYHEISETNYPTHVRLSTGIHTVTFDHYSGRTQSLAFTVYDGSHQICLRIKKYGLLTEKYTLEAVTVD